MFWTAWSFAAPVPSYQRLASPPLPSRKARVPWVTDETARSGSAMPWSSGSGNIRSTYSGSCAMVGPFDRPADDRTAPDWSVGDGDEQLAVPAHGAREEKLAALVVDVPLRVAGERLLERDPAFEPGQCRTETEVDAVPERHVLVELPVDVEAVRVGKRALVPARRAG